MSQTVTETATDNEDRWLLSTGGSKLHRPIIIDGTPRASCDQKIQLSVERTDKEGEDGQDDKCVRCSTPIQDRKPIVPNQPRFSFGNARYTF